MRALTQERVSGREGGENYIVCRTEVLSHAGGGKLMSPQLRMLSWRRPLRPSERPAAEIFLVSNLAWPQVVCARICCPSLPLPPSLPIWLPAGQTETIMRTGGL